MPVKVSIEPPRAGWIGVALDLDGRQVAMRVTYVGGDCLRALTDAVRAFEEDGLTQTLDLPDEPGLHRLVWTARGDGATLAIAESASGKPADLRPVARVQTATRLELTLPFWRALRKLATEFPPLPNREWPYAYPEEAVRLLSVAVARHKGRPA